MELMLNVFMAVAAAITLMLTFAKATTEHRALALSWMAHLVILTVLSIAVVWFGRAVMLFLLNQGPLTRAAVFNFALSFFNVIAYTSLLIGYLGGLAGKKAFKSMKQERELAKVQEEAKLLASAQRYTDVQIAVALEGLRGSAKVAEVPAEAP